MLKGLVEFRWGLSEAFKKGHFPIHKDISKAYKSDMNSEQRHLSNIN